MSTLSSDQVNLLSTTLLPPIAEHQSTNGRDERALKKVRKFGLILSVLILIGVGIALFLNRPQAKPKEYGFLKGATLIESVKKDPRYGGGQRDVYEVRGELNEVLERVRREVAPVSKTKNVGDTAISYYPDGDNTIIIGAGKALPWSDVIKALALATDQEMKEAVQKGFGFRPAQGVVSIIIDRPYAELAAKALTGLNRKLSPPKPQPDTNVDLKLVRVGKDVEVQITISNTGTATQDEFIVDQLMIGGSAPAGMPIKVTNLKVGATHIENRKLPNLIIKGATVPSRMEITANYKGSGYSGTIGKDLPVPR